MPQSTIRIVLIISLLIWAGVCIGANMIAAPAKFQVVDLTLPVALQVGRVQFQWVGYVEFIFAVAVALAAFTAPPRLRLLIGAAIVIFILQRAVILPQLSVRTDQVIAGQGTIGSHLHIYFIIAELLKIIMVMVGAITALGAMTTKAKGA